MADDAFHLDARISTPNPGGADSEASITTISVATRLVCTRAWATCRYTCTCACTGNCTVFCVNEQ